MTTNPGRELLICQQGAPSGGQLVLIVDPVPAVATADQDRPAFESRLSQYYPLAIVETPSGLTDSILGGTWQEARSIDLWQRKVINRFPAARPQYLRGGCHIRWIAGGRVVGEVVPDPKDRRQWVGWVLEGRDDDEVEAEEAVDRRRDSQGPQGDQ